MLVVLTTAGQALVAGSTGPVIVTSFALGDGKGYVPQPSDTALHGNTVYTGVPSAPLIVNANVVKYSMYLDFNLGPFVFGEVGLFVGSTLFALAVSDVYIQKTPISVGGNAGNSIRIDEYLSVVSTNYAMWLDLSTSNNQFQMAVLGSVDQLPPSANAVPNAYIISGLSGSQSSFQAYTDKNALWNFDAYQFANQATVPIVGASDQSVTINLSDFLPGFSPAYLGAVIAEFTTGVNYSICRYVSNVVISGSTATINFYSKMLQVPSIGDHITFFGRQQLSTTIPNLPIASHSQLGGVIVGNTLTVDGTGLINVAPSALPVTSVNGKTGAVVLTASDIGGFATVAYSGNYSDLIGAPPAYTLPVANTTTLGGVKASSTDSNIAIAGDGTITLGFNPVKTVNGNSPDSSGNVTLVIPTPPPQTVYIGLVQPAAMTTGQDLNQMQTTGLFFATDTVASSLVNAPVTSTGGTLDIEPFTTTASGGDVIQRYTTQDDIYWRRYIQSSNTWTPWVAAATSLSLPVATSSVLGGIIVGPTLTIDGAGHLNVGPITIPTATSSVLGGVKIGTGINVAGDGTISTVAATAGPNLLWNGSGEFGAAGWTLDSVFTATYSNVYGYLFSSGSSITTTSFTETSPSVAVAASTAYSVGIDIQNLATAGTVVLNLNFYTSGSTFISSSSLTLTNGINYTRATLSTTSPSNAASMTVSLVGTGVTAPAAGIQFKRIKVESGTTNSGYSADADIKVATTGQVGLVKVGANLAITSDGTLSATAQPLSPATTTALGGVIVPTSGRLSVDGSGNISVPIATTSVLGVVKVGSGLSVAGDGTLSANSGTVTSVGLTMPSTFTVTGSPVTSSGTLAVTYNTQTANTVLAGPTTGAAAAPTFRSLVAADIPIATSSAVGGVKGGGTVSIAGDGTLGLAPGGTTAQWVRGDGSTSNTLTGSATIQGALTVGNTSTANVGFELGSTTTVVSTFIDFHSSGNNIDYDSRILATGGNSTVGSGTITISAGGGINLSNTTNINVDSALSINASNNAIIQLKTSSYNRLWYLGNDGNTYLSVSNGSFGATSILMSVSASGVVTAADFTATSDRRKKKDIVPVTGAREKILKIEGVYFRLIEDETGKRRIGFIAQDIAEQLPEVVNEGKEGLGVSYGNVTALLVEGFKEQDAELQELKSRLKQLEALVANLVGDK